MVFGVWRLAFLEAVEAKNALLYHAQAAGESGLTVLQARADSQSKATLYHTQSGNACVDIHHDSQRQACCGGHDQGRCSMCGARQSSERRIPTRASCQGDARRHRTSRSHAGRGGARPGGCAGGEGGVPPCGYCPARVLPGLARLGAGAWPAAQGTRGEEVS